MLSILCGLALVLSCPNCDESKDPRRGPWICPLWELMYIDEGVLYYADYYLDNECVNPEASYAFGVFPWPMICPECEPAALERDKQHLGKKFLGLHSKVPLDYVLTLPAPANHWTEISLDQEIPYLKFTGEEFYAKVFRLDMDVAGIQNSDEPEEPYVRYVALQVNEKPNVGFSEVTPKKLDGDPCYAFSATKELANGKEIKILVLKAREAK